MKRQRINEKIWRLFWLQVILFACVGSMLPACIGLAAGSDCAHNYVIQQAEPGSGRTNKICSKCGDTKQVTLPTKLSAFTWIRDNVSSGTLEWETLEIGDVINVRVQCLPSNVGNRDIVVEISDPSIASMNSLPEGSNHVASFTIIGTGKMTVTAYLKYDPTVRISSEITVPVITDEMVNGGPGGPKDFTGLDVEYHTQEQIRNYYKKYPNYNPEPKYSIKPSLTAPYVMGELSNETKQDALNLLNILRYVTGVPTVSISDDSQKAAQAASTVFAINDDISHFIIKKPIGISDEMFKLAQVGAMNSNLVGCRPRLGDTLMAYMEDQGNYDDFGHRMQLLKPLFNKGTGFGIAYSKSGIHYSATYVDALAGKVMALSYPAQNQPIEYFGKDYGWTVVLTEAIYTSKINIKLTNVKTGKVWNFKKGSENLKFDRGGVSTTLIFFPEDIEYKEGDKYRVEITGVKNPISYDVNMFRLTDGESIERAIVKYPPLAGNGFSYTGREKKPRIHLVRLGTFTLTEGTDYMVSYENNKNAGTAKIKITGKGYYHGTITKTFKINARFVTQKGIRYKISDNTGAVCVGLEKNTKINGFLTIPDTIPLLGKKYKVKSIAANAFQKSKMTGVSIGKNVRNIGKSAFMNCKKLKTIKIKSKKLKSVGKKAFKGIKAKAKIKVPAKKLKAYKKLLKGKGQGKKVTITQKAIVFH